jgi:hypothetical protein
MTPMQAVVFMAALAAVGVAIDAAQTLVARSSLAPTGLFSWKVLRLGRHYLVAGRLARPLGMLFRYPQILALPILQLACAPFLLFAPLLPSQVVRPTVAFAALTTAMARMLFYMRQQFGLDGADHMLVVVLLATGFGALFGDTAAGSAAVDYAALQLLLSYAVAGTAKAISPTWRSGHAIVGVTRTIDYGQTHVHRLVKRYRVLAKATCWSVIGFECLAAPLILLGVKGAWVVLIAGLCFHIGVAAVMGLNVYVWAFAACYPALLLLGSQIDKLLGH